MPLSTQQEQQKFNTLAEVFGYQTFRPGQEETVDALVCGQDVLAVMPTGAGKSICYQLPALMLPGITLVVSPLISLMQDQVRALLQAGVRAAYINSSLTDGQCRKALFNAGQGMYKIIFVAPERLLTPNFLYFAFNANISLVCVDEAHCVSQWGQDFRPSYLQISEFLTHLQYRPALGAFTATATSRVKTDIKNALHLQQPLEVTTGFDRPNLFFEVQRVEERQKYAYLKRYLFEHPDANGIVYCSTRKKVDAVAAQLVQDDISAAAYHAGLPQDQRTATQQDFLFDRVRVMVATNAFGMGIDKSNVNFVVHFNMPMDVESYYQEAGRAGRDGQPADCILLYAASDVRTANYLIDNAEAAADADEDEVEAARQKQRERLRKMTFYCHSKRCLRGELLQYFGQKQAKSCGNCSVCAPETARVTYQEAPRQRAEKPQMLDGEVLNPNLWKSLKALRSTVAKRQGVPAFVVFTDATLRHMCAVRPKTREQFLAVPGVGKAKAERYGEEFLRAIRQHEEQE